MAKQNAWTDAKKPRYGSKRLALFASVLLAVIFIAGCASPSQPATPSASPSATANATAGCSDKDCFMQAANDCKDLSLAITEDVGIFKYSSSKDCIFTKTAVTLNESEPQDMKSALEGKSFTCNYEKGKFDQRLVTSLIFGMENCDGPLKDALGQLIAFS